MNMCYYQNVPLRETRNVTKIDHRCLNNNIIKLIEINQETQDEYYITSYNGETQIHFNSGNRMVISF